jgi:hypothetical protein
VLRRGLGPGDLGLVLQAAASARGETPARTVALRHRLLDVLVEGLRADAPPLDPDGPGTPDPDAG